MTSKNYPYPCKESRTNADKDWPYDEYYIGDKDKEGRKTGSGQYFWSGAESLECYTGRFLRDTKHGIGQYNCRHRGSEDSDLTWEGHYYNNNMHGYGLMSYRNGQVFSGLYHSNLRWGPGVETRITLRENVGLWHGDQLVRLTWTPPCPSVAPDLLSTPIGVQVVSTFRTILKLNVKKIGDINPALELLKQCGAKPIAASNKWHKLYPNNCTDERSQFFYSDVFDRDFYGSTILTLESTNPLDFNKTRSQGSISSDSSPEFYYAWNNNTTIKHIMNHCYQHDFQMKYPKMNLDKILNGPRSYFKPAAQEELDCRAFLMACYLGHIKNVSQLINEYDVHPNVTDMQGNSAMMYAVCGNQTEVIHFLLEAGALIDCYNDACCTPLGAALLNYACSRCDVPPSQMIQAILPPSVISSENVEITEWKIERISGQQRDSEIINKPPIVKPPNGTHKIPTSYSGRDITKKESKLEAHRSQENKLVVEPLEIVADDNQLYNNLLNEFAFTLKELYEPVDGMKSTIPVSYMFESRDMIADLNLILEEQVQAQLQSKKAAPDKNAARRLSRELTVLTELAKSMSYIDPVKIKRLNDQMKTIEQLLKNGADPRRANCPQSALFIAVAAQSAELVELLIKHGADTNEKHPESLDYSALEIAVSRPLTQENLNVIQKLLEGGANAKDLVPVANNFLLPSQSSMPSFLGPTLLHVALEKSVDEAGEKNYNDLLQLLLHYGCDPIIQYRGVSAMDKAMSKTMDVFNIFIESPNTDLNAAINSYHQTILTKMFSMSYCRTIPVAQRLQMLTSLLLYGADPLVKCENDSMYYDNLFEYTKVVETELSASSKAPPPANQPIKTKPDKPDPKKKDVPEDKTSAVSSKGGPNEELNDFIQTLGLVRDCARILYIRWIQATLMKEIVELTDKYKHRNWTMVLKEYKKGKRCGLWLTPIRCLEIWDILKTTKKRVYSDRTVLKFVLYMVQFYYKKQLKLVTQITAEAKTAIEIEVSFFIREHASNTNLERVTKRVYVRPELTPPSKVNKFNICFECALPLKEDMITCSSCKLVSFCTLNCMRDNIERTNCHPCNEYLKLKYFPIVVEEEETGAETVP